MIAVGGDRQAVDREARVGGGLRFGERGNGAAGQTRGVDRECAAGSGVTGQDEMVAAGLGTVVDDGRIEAVDLAVDAFGQRFDRRIVGQFERLLLAADGERERAGADVDQGVVEPLRAGLLRLREGQDLDVIGAGSGGAVGGDAENAVVVGRRAQGGELVGGVDGLRGVLEGRQFRLERIEGGFLRLVPRALALQPIDRRTADLDELGDDGRGVQSGCETGERNGTHHCLPRRRQTRRYDSFGSTTTVDDRTEYIGRMPIAVE